jgi:hypothetical protein
MWIKEPRNLILGLSGFQISRIEEPEFLATGILKSRNAKRLLVRIVVTTSGRMRRRCELV